MKKTVETKVMESRNNIMMPTYYEAFKCIGGACEDTCCAGWYLPVDESTLKKYKKVKHPEMKRRLDKEIVVKKKAVDPSCAAKIKLKNSRCAFLSQEGWCDIHTTLGDAYLSESCTFYPRTANQLNQRMEYSLTLSCPEAARCVLMPQEGISFKNNPTQSKGATPIVSANLQYATQKPKVWQDYFDTYRSYLITTLQDRSLSIDERLGKIEQQFGAVEACVKRQTLKQITERLTQPVKTQKIEPFSEHVFDKMQEVFTTMDTHKKLHSQTYKVTLEQVMALDYNAYTKCLADKVEALEKDYAYILENYLVYYVFDRCVPLDFATPYQSIERILFYYQLIRLHIAAMLYAREDITKEKLITFIQGFTKVYDHGENHLSQLLKCLEA